MGKYEKQGMTGLFEPRPGPFNNRAEWPADGATRWRLFLLPSHA